MEKHFDYMAEAAVTCSDSYHGHKVTVHAFRDALDRAIKVGNELDAMKKALFYGRGDDIGNTAGMAPQLMSQAPYMITGKLIEEASENETKQAIDILHGIVGKHTEGVELLERLRAVMFGEPKLSHADVQLNLLEEVGDGLWYDAIILRSLGSNFGNEQRRNIAKLRKRFHEKFNEYDANNRDIDGELLVMAEHGDAHLRDGLGLPLPGTVSVRNEPLEGEKLDDSAASPARTMAALIADRNEFMAADQRAAHAASVGNAERADYLAGDGNEVIPSGF